jgi:hypothetical protein
MFGGYSRNNALLGFLGVQPSSPPQNALSGLGNIYQQFMAPVQYAGNDPMRQSALRALQSLPQSYGEASEGWRNAFHDAQRDDPTIGSFEEFMTIQRAAIARVMARHGQQIDARPPIVPRAKPE